MSEWISVEDRLPRHGIEALVLFSDDTYSIDSIPFDVDATHWQPLPEPPQPTNLIDSFIADGGFDREIGEVK